MTTRWKCACVFVAVLTVGALVRPIADQAAAYSAYRRFRDPNWLTTATPEQARVTAERALGWWFGKPHDEFLILMEHGDQSSVPYIRAALRRAPSRNKRSCAWGHAEEALKRLCPNGGGEIGVR